MFAEKKGEETFFDRKKDGLETFFTQRISKLEAPFSHNMSLSKNKTKLLTYEVTRFYLLSITI